MQSCFPPLGHVEPSEFSMEFERHEIVSLGGVLFASEMANLDALPTGHYPSFPRPNPVSANALIFRCGLGVRLTVHSVLLSGAIPKIRSPIIQTISVNVVGTYAGWCLHDHSMHSEAF